MHTIVQAMSSEQKVDFFNHHLLRNSHLQSNEKENVAWLCKVVDLLSPFIRDDNKMVRESAASGMKNVIDAVVKLLDEEPSITRTRITEGLLSKVKQNHPAVSRTKKSFVKKIHRKSGDHDKFPSSPSADIDFVELNKLDVNLKGRKSYVKRNTLHANREAKYFETTQHSNE